MIHRYGEICGGIFNSRKYRSVEKIKISLRERKSEIRTRRKADKDTKKII